MSIEDCREKLPMPDLVGRYVSDSELSALLSGNAIRSPIREEQEPSFTIYKSESSGLWRWHDHAENENGDEVNFIERHAGLNQADAIRAYHELAGVTPRGKPGPKPAGKAKKKKPRPATTATMGGFPTLDPVGGGEEEVYKPAPRRAKIVHCYDYNDGAGQLIHQTVKFEPKKFRQRRPARPDEDDEVNGGWVWSLKGIALMPYRLEALAAAGEEEPVWLAEGEKDADTLAEVGVLSTSVTNGVGKWRPEYDEYFQGKTVVICEDFDDVKQNGKRPGEVGAIKTAIRLMGLGCRVYYVRIRSYWRAAPEGSDMHDLVEYFRHTMADEDIGKLLQETYRDHKPPAAAVFAKGIMQALSDEKPKLLEGELARRLVDHFDLIFSGASWWRYGTPTSSAPGTYSQLETGLEILAWIREAMELAPASAELISAYKLGSIEATARTLSFRHPERFNIGRKIHVDGKATDKEDVMVNCQNGMYSLRSGNLYSHSRAYLSTSQIGTHYDPAAECPTWLEWLAKMQPIWDQTSVDVSPGGWPS